MSQCFQTTATKKILALKARIRAVQGGSSGGKTLGILLALIGHAQAAGKVNLDLKKREKELFQSGFSKEQIEFSHKTLSGSPILISIVSESLPHLKRGAIRDFLNILETQGCFKEERWNRTDFIYTFETGSKIEFFGVEQSDKVKGPRRDVLFLNEAINVEFETFEQLSIRTNGYIFLDWNPSEEFWFNTEILPNRKDVEHIILTYKDNEALPQNIIDDLEQKRYRKNWARVYLDGLLGDVEGRIYSNWKVISEIPHEARLERYGLDWGYSNDFTAIVAVYYYNGGWILDQRCYKKGMSNKDIADTFKAMPERLIIADSAEPKGIDELRNYGLNVQSAKKGKDSVRNGIQFVKDQPISVTRHSTDLLSEYRGYFWMIDKNGKIETEPERVKDHLMDALRYALSTLALLAHPVSYWDKAWEEELTGSRRKKPKVNLER